MTNKTLQKHIMKALEDFVDGLQKTLKKHKQSSTPPTLYMQCTTGSHNKFYKMVLRKNNDVDITYGRIGAVGSNITVPSTSEYAARSYISKMKKSKLAKGYYVVAAKTTI